MSLNYTGLIESIDIGRLRDLCNVQDFITGDFNNLKIHLKKLRK